MEALVLIFGEMIFALLAPLVAVVVDLAAAILASIFSFIPSSSRRIRISGAAAKKVLFVLLAIAAISVGALAVINKFYFADSVRMVFGVLERRSGIEANCSDIDGSLFSGQVSLGNCAFARSGHPSSEFELQLEQLRFDLNMGSLFGTAEVQTAHISGLKGSVRRHHTQSDTDGEIAVEKPRRSFVIQDLKVEDIDISLSGLNKDGGRFELPVLVASATSAPLRSRLALFDILFRSNASGEIAGAEFKIQTAGDAGGRQTIWRASDVPVASFGAVTGGALSWFRNGVVDIYVEDNWRRDGQLEIDMDWNLRFRDVEVQAPETAAVMTRLATAPIVDYVNSHGGEFPFEFQMIINESQFEYQSSLAAAGLWTAVGAAVNNLLAGFGIDVGKSASETGDKLKEEAKSVLDRLRRPRDEDE